MDFYKIVVKADNKGVYQVEPDFIMGRSSDFMVRSNSFYAVWDEDKKMWSTDQFDLFRLLENDLRDYAKKLSVGEGSGVHINSLSFASSKTWTTYNNFLKNMPDTNVTLDNKVTFQNSDVSKKDYVSKRVPYSLEPGPFEAYDELMSTLYDPLERRKLEWAIGSIIKGDSKHIQKFIVLYGEAGSGKSTVLNIIQDLFEGYYTTFEAKALVGSNNTFSTDAFRSNPLVAIQHDGDLSRIDDNSKLNSIVSHEEMQINEKFKPSYTARFNCFLFMGTNRPVKITDAKSGLIRRLIDVHPSGRKFEPSRYYDLVEKIRFELGHIAYHCLQVYEDMGKNYYNGYTPECMMLETDPFFNFVEENYLQFKRENWTSLKRVWELYKEYFSQSNLKYDMPKHRVREELKNYFEEFYPITRVDGAQIRNCYIGFKWQKFTNIDEEQECPEINTETWLKLNETESIFDKECSEAPAQYATGNEAPLKKWDEVNTRLKDIDTRKLHYVRVPENHIVIDFDLKDENGNKSRELNSDAVKNWPRTYAEYSKGGAGIHLHYIYDGDVNKLSSMHSENIEVKVFKGKSSLRRKLTFCNDLPIAHISSGLPFKEESTKVVDFNVIMNEKAIRTLIEKNLRKEYHSSTAQSVDFIYHILDEQYNLGAKYDVRDLRNKVLSFAANSTNQSAKCMILVANMHFCSDDAVDREFGDSIDANEDYKDDDIIFYDVEVFPNLFLVNWKVAGKDKQCVRMINPGPNDIEPLFNKKLIGFNCRRYDNHIMYARYLGYDNKELYDLSQKIINKDKNDDSQRNCFFREAYNLSYTDVYDFASAGNKKSLKKFEIELGIHHQELGLPWDKPVPEDQWIKVAEYCDNDVIATEAVFEHLQGDWAARQILSKLSGLSLNDTTNQHSTKIMFGEDRNPQSQFKYWELDKPVKNLDDSVFKYLKKNTPLPLTFVPPYDNNQPSSILPYFPGYKFENGQSTYRGDIASEGGYVYSEPGIHYNVALLDVASLHPSSAEDMCVFGPKYSQRLSDLKKGRVAFKHEDFKDIDKILNGALIEFAKLVEDGVYSSEDISNALKTVINSMYGLTSATFPNAFKDPKNKDNIVAKRGALFMIDLKNAVQNKGFKVAHIKTDSIKIPNATPEIIKFVMDFGKYYGYTFEHEATYEKMCLIDKANYVAKYKLSDQCNSLYGYCPKKNSKKSGRWDVTGDFFAHPYIFKTIFTHEPIEFRDYGETKSVSTALYLDMNEDLPNVEQLEKEYDAILKKFGEEDQRLVSLAKDISEGHNYRFVGKVGLFVPIASGKGGGVLVRKKGDEEDYDSASGAKGYRWLEFEDVKQLGMEEDIDITYYRKLVDDALDKISEFGDVEAFISDDIIEESFDVLPWCNKEDCNNCKDRADCHSLAASYATNV